MRMIMPSDKEITYKKIGETPLQALERFRVLAGIPSSVPMTYAGRLDPLAEGELLVLTGNECKNKEKYLGLDKEYEVEIVFGISTDTYDALGLASIQENGSAGDSVKHANVATSIDLTKYCGKFMQKYPAYSSKTVGGKQLHELARAGDLPDPEEMPEKEVEIYSIEKIEKVGQDRVQWKISATDLLVRIVSMIDLVDGDFRQAEIKKKWHDLLSTSKSDFYSLKIRVKCSSGTYMRSLANRMGQDFGGGAFAISIRRTKIFGV